MDKLKLLVTYIGFNGRITETWEEDRWGRNLSRDNKGNLWIELQGHIGGSQSVCKFNLGKCPKEPVDLDKLYRQARMI